MEKKYTIEDIKSLENIGFSIIGQIENDYCELEKNDKNKVDRLDMIREILNKGE
ncbi:MAG: hypothetical protein K2I06_08520 [Ruminococcus sp.]|nr:hypothetical protein [Ruminococcus sp.]